MGRVTEIRVTPTSTGFVLQAYRKLARGKTPIGVPLEVATKDTALSDAQVVDWYRTVNPPKSTAADA